MEPDDFIHCNNFINYTFAYSLLLMIVFRVYSVVRRFRCRCSSVLFCWFGCSGRG